MFNRIRRLHHATSFRKPTSSHCEYAANRNGAKRSCPMFWCIPKRDKLSMETLPTTGKHSDLPWADRLRVTSQPTTGKHSDLPWADCLRVTSPPTTGKHSGFAMGRLSTCDVTTNNGETFRICLRVMSRQQDNHIRLVHLRNLAI